MGWWEHLTSGQGTLLGGIFVVIAGVLAFANGWRDRRAAERRFHYTETKRVYVKALHYTVAIALQSERMAGGGKGAAPNIDVEDMLMNMSEVALTGDYETSELLVRFMMEKVLGQQSASPRDRLPRTEPIKGGEVIEKIRHNLAQYVPRTTRYGRSLRMPIQHERVSMFDGPGNKPPPAADPAGSSN
jgi:hypothetical protein